MQQPLTLPRACIVHEWLTDWGGSEDVVRAMAACLPDAPLYATIDFLSAADRARMAVPHIHTTFLQHMPFVRKRFWHYLPWTPLAVEAHDLRAAEVVVSSSHAFAKGALVRGDQLHVSYVHSPMRYAWDLHHEYLADYKLNRGIKGWLARRMFQQLRAWDRQTANNVDLFLANSRHVQQRIWRCYRRPSVVLHPPVRVRDRSLGLAKSDFYLTVSRLVSYKRVDLIVEAFASMPGRRLVVIGDGPEMAALRRNCPPNVQLMGWQPDEVVDRHLREARAFVFAAREDFGISPVEAQACGTPVIAYGAGGALETVRDASAAERPTGIFFPSQTPASLSEAVLRFEAMAGRFDPHDCRDWAMEFDESVFRTRFSELLGHAWSLWKSGPHDLERTLVPAR